MEGEEAQGKTLKSSYLMQKERISPNSHNDLHKRDFPTETVRFLVNKWLFKHKKMVKIVTDLIVL